MRSVKENFCLSNRANKLFAKWNVLDDDNSDTGDVMRTTYLMRETTMTYQYFRHLFHSYSKDEGTKEICCEYVPMLVNALIEQKKYAKITDRIFGKILSFIYA